MRRTQLEKIKGVLYKHRVVSRNECIRAYPAIIRLAPRISQLKDLGWKFRTERKEGDFLYHVVRRPAPKQLAL